MLAKLIRARSPVDPNRGSRTEITRNEPEPVLDRTLSIFLAEGTLFAFPRVDPHEASHLGANGCPLLAETIDWPVSP